MNKKRVYEVNYLDLLPFSPGRLLKLFFKIKYGHPLDYPQDIWIEITNECNLQCIMCPQSKRLKIKKMMMDIDAFVRIIDQIYMNKPRILLHVTGEPLLNKNLFEMIAYAKNRGCWVCIHTNATLLTKEVSMRILESSLDYISFSFDGTTPEIYEKIRVGAKFEQVRSQIEAFLKLRDERKAKSPFTKIEMLVMKETKKNIHDFIEYWKAKKVDQIVIRPVGTWVGLVDDHRVTIRTLNFGHRVCRDIFDKCTILVDGTVVPCCNDAARKLPLGNIFKQPFNEIWTGSLYNRLRKQHLKNAIPEDSICYECFFSKCWDRKRQIIEWFLGQFFWRNANI